MKGDAALYTYHLDELAMPLPSGFRDLSTNVFDWPLEGKEHMSLVVQRKPAERSLDEEAKLLRTEYERKFLAFVEEGDQPPEGLASESRRHLRFRWRSPQGTLYQHQVLLDTGALVLVLIASAKAPYRREVDALIEQMLSGVQLRAL